MKKRKIYIERWVLFAVLFIACVFMVPLEDLLIIFIGITYISLLFYFFIKGLYKQARESMEQARQEFRAVTGHDPPKSSRDNCFQWDKVKGK